VNEIARALDQLEGLGGEDGVHLVQECLGSLHQAGIGCPSHLPRYDVLSSAEGRPVVVREPERDVDLEDLHELDEVVRPA